MIRIVAFLVVAALAALGAAWVAERPGQIVMTWQSWQVTTSLAVALVFFIAAVLAAMLIWTIARFILRSPDLVSLFFRERRRARGWRAITQGLLAVGTGNLALAHRSASEARKFAGDNPLTLLLAAQTAQLEGDASNAEREFRAMLGRDDTKLLGLRGLYIEAVRRNDPVAAYGFAQEAARSDAMPAWSAEALIEFQTRARDWRAAIATLEAAVAAGVVDKTLARRRRAVLLTAQALEAEENNPALARELGQEAVKLAPDLVPAAALTGRLLGIEGSLRKAAGIIEKAWAAMPHPDLALAYTHLRPGDAAEDRLKRARKLAKKKSDALESKLMLARAALEAQHFVEARTILESLSGDPTQRTCLLMAELEAAEHGDHGKAREWTVRALRAKRDPAWIADGYVSQEWLPASPRTGALDAFVWAVPDAAPGGPILDQAAEIVLTVPPPASPASLSESVSEAAEAKALSGRKAAFEPAPPPVVAEPPRPDDPGPDAPGPEIAEETPPPRGFSLFGWRPGPSA
jgi:HemY protein